ncbi:Uncharacterized protein BM_BM10895 [Brugia malayi]|uniref:Bm10895 n=1 Tax=Brugia malayi TaxID=6279 RepID=A0A0J9Y2J7_BRUMA|nr:Uncharacterized protein BM_BM10895 [Brugia malayi]CDQ00307.1 Bm10895 [Brugia malayi]VIO90901.1 Uncharacterized protein BM_BM10895 [Brugia malayi]
MGDGDDCDDDDDGGDDDDDIEGIAGVEPATLGLLDPRSNRLSYGGYVVYL